MRPVHLLIAAAAIAALALIGNMEREDQIAEREHYCEMVDLHHESGGEYGWPPYKGECE